MSRCHPFFQVFYELTILFFSNIVLPPADHGPLVFLEGSMIQFHCLGHQLQLIVFLITLWVLAVLAANVHNNPFFIFGFEDVELASGLL